jgi:hypothetical protein
MKILHLSDTHGLHRRIKDIPEADVIIHSGDISHNGTEEEVLDFLNWFIELPYKHKIFVTGNHDLCLWDAECIEELPENVHFLQHKSVEIDGVKFFGLAYNHPEELIPDDTDVVILPVVKIVSILRERFPGVQANRATFIKVGKILVSMGCEGHRGSSGNAYQVVVQEK